LVALTRSSSARQGRLSAAFSVLVGLLGVAAIPAAIFAAEWRRDIALIEAAAAIPAAAVFGLAALWLSRRARRRAKLTVAGRGSATARVGRTLGLLALLLAGTAALALGWYALLTWRGRS
jgi:hypothetical protein